MTTDYDAFERGLENKRLAAIAVRVYRGAADMVGQELARQRGTILEPPTVALPIRTVEESVVYEDNGKARLTTNSLMRRLLAGGVKR